MVLPPLFLHFALVFPERPHLPGYSAHAGALAAGRCTCPARCSARRARSRVLRSGIDPEYFVRVIALLDRLEYALPGGVPRGRARRAACARSSRARSVTVKRQLRWIVWGTALGAMPFALGYAIPFALGVDPSMPMGLSAIPLGFIPLAFASAIIRYRLMDVEIILKRLLIYTSAVAAIVAIYVVDPARLGRLPRRRRGRTSLDHRVPGDRGRDPAGQAGEGRTAEGDRSRVLSRSLRLPPALVGFARELNSDLDSNRLADRLVTRVSETIELDRMAFLLAIGCRRLRVDQLRRLRRAACRD